MRRSSYTVDGVLERVGATPTAALARHETAAVRHVLGADRDPLALLIRLLLLGEDVAVDDVRALLPVEQMASLVHVSGGRARCSVEVAPHAEDGADWWVLSDRVGPDGRPQRGDHVLGVGGASTTLAQLTVRRHVRRALDVGTGCGVQALHLTRHTDAVTATDTNPRALSLAATGFALSGVAVELVEGNLVEPVRDREFDLVVCNPPFVVGPTARFTYRDAGRPGDAISRDAIRAAASVLADGGIAQLLVNWLDVAGERWEDRVASWVGDLGCDAWLVERDRQEPVDYVSTWLADAGEQRDDALAERWLAYLAAARVEAVGFGWVVIRRGGAPHRIAVEAAGQPVDQPLGPAIGGWLDRVDWLRGRDDEALLAACLRAATAVRHDVTAGTDPDGGWLRLGQALRLDEGWRWTMPCDDATAAVVAGCDGRTPLRAVAAVLAAALDEPTERVEPHVCATVRGLVDRGVLLPPSA